MKKWVSGLLALLMILTLFTGCANETPQESTEESHTGVFYELTGIPVEKTVMTVSGVNITAEEYFYWLAYLCTSIEYNILNYNAYYGMYSNLVNDDGTLNWDEEFQDGMTLAEYARMEAEATIKFYTAIELTAQKYNAGLDESDKAAIIENLNGAIEELGGKEAFDLYLNKLGICQETFEDLSASSYLYDNLLLLVLEEGTDLYLELENYNKYATYADHILLTTIDLDSGKALSATQMAEKKALAEDLLAQLQAAEDLETLFDQLADQYSEDTGRATNPDGYVYTPNTMVQSFEDAVAALNPGEISGIVESDYGYHIVLRKDLLEAIEADPEQRVSLAETHLTTLLTILSGEATVEVDDAVLSVDVGQFYADYKVKVEEMTIQIAESIASAAQAENAAS